MPEAPSHPVRVIDIEAARTRGRDVVLETPTLPSQSFSRMTGAEVLLKAEIFFLTKLGR